MVSLENATGHENAISPESASQRHGSRGIISRVILAWSSRRVYVYTSARLASTLLVTSLFPRAARVCLTLLTRIRRLFAVSSAPVGRVCCSLSLFLAFSAESLSALSSSPPSPSPSSSYRRSVARVAALVIRGVRVNCRIHAGSAGRVARARRLLNSEAKYCDVIHLKGKHATVSRARRLFTEEVLPDRWRWFSDGRIARARRQIYASRSMR